MYLSIDRQSYCFVQIYIKYMLNVEKNIYIRKNGAFCWMIFFCESAHPSNRFKKLRVPFNFKYKTENSYV